MRCPDCELDMDTVTRNGVTVDQCPRCGSLWFDRGEIKHYLEWAADGLRDNRIGDQHFQLVSGAPTDECPHCSTNGFKRGSFKTASFGACMSCGGLYLHRSDFLKLLEPNPKRKLTFLERQRSLLDFLFWGESLWFLGFMKLFYDELSKKRTT